MTFVFQLWTLWTVTTTQNENATVSEQGLNPARNNGRTPSFTLSSPSGQGWRRSEGSRQVSRNISHFSGQKGQVCQRNHEETHIQEIPLFSVRAGNHNHSAQTQFSLLWWNKGEILCLPLVPSRAQTACPAALTRLRQTPTLWRNPN